MKKASIIYQDYGTSILLFIKGKTQQDAYNQWLSLFNWGATSTEPQDVADNVISCWSTVKKFQRYFFNLHENRLWQNRPIHAKGEMDIEVMAYGLAKAEFEAVQTESFRSVNSEGEPFEFGVICAEKPDDDFADAVLNYAFSNSRNHFN